MELKKEDPSRLPNLYEKSNNIFCVKGVKEPVKNQDPVIGKDAKLKLDLDKRPVPNQVEGK